MELRLIGKRALVTGSTSGIGEQIARLLRGKVFRLLFMAGGRPKRTAWFKRSWRPEEWPSQPSAILE